MDGWLRRLRAAFMTGVIWGFGWFSAGMVMLLIVGPNAADVPFPLGFGMLGFFAGGMFSVVLGVAERGRRVEQVSLTRFTFWGALGGLLLAVIFVTVVGLTGGGPLNLEVVAPIFVAAGAGSAALSHVLAGLSDDGRTLRKGDQLGKLR